MMKTRQRVKKGLESPPPPISWEAVKHKRKKKIVKKAEDAPCYVSSITPRNPKIRKGEIRSGENFVKRRLEVEFNDVLISLSESGLGEEAEDDYNITTYEDYLEHDVDEAFHALRRQFKFVPSWTAPENLAPLLLMQLPEVFASKKNRLIGIMFPIILEGTRLIEYSELETPFGSSPPSPRDSIEKS